MKTIKAGVIGATGYAGLELVRLLLAHPHAEVTAVSSVSLRWAGDQRRLSAAYGAVRSDADGRRRRDRRVRRCVYIHAGRPRGAGSPPVF